METTLTLSYQVQTHFDLKLEQLSFDNPKFAAFLEENRTLYVEAAVDLVTTEFSEEAAVEHTLQGAKKYFETVAPM